MTTPAMPCNQRTVLLLSALMMLGFLSACGSRLPDLEAPAVSFLRLDAGTGQADLRVANPVAAPLPARHLVLTISVDGRDLGTFRPELDLTIPPLGSERVRIQIATDNPALLALDDRSVRYHISGSVAVAAQRSLQIDSEGWLSPTPGRSGSYR